MNEAEIDGAMDYIRQGWAYTPLPQTQDRQFRDIFRAYPKQDIRKALSDLIRVGAQRPSPKELGGILHSLGRVAHSETVAELTETRLEDLRSDPECVPMPAHLKAQRKELKR